MRIGAPADGFEIVSTLDIRGAVYDPPPLPSGLSYSVTLSPLDALPGGTPVTVSTVAGPGPFGGAASDVALATLDPTKYANGAYELVVSAADGNSTTTVTRLVTINSRFKIGNLALSFVDLQVPMGGLPITITRSYDSQRASELGDFGFGWRLDLPKTKAQVLVPAGKGSAPLNQAAPIVDGTRVVITLPDGSSQGFVFAPRPVSGIGSITTAWAPAFLPDFGVTSSLSVDEVLLTNANLGGAGYLTERNEQFYNPLNDSFGNRFYLRTRTGVNAHLELTH